MTRIRATCPHCGEVDLRPDDVSLHIVRSPGDDDTEVREGSAYRFECPSCETVIEKPADARIARLLTTGGVTVEVEDADAQIVALPEHPELPNGGPNFSLNDLIDFHFLLERDDWFGVLSTLERAGR